MRWLSPPQHTNKNPTCSLKSNPSSPSLSAKTNVDLSSSAISFTFYQFNASFSLLLLRSSAKVHWVVALLAFLSLFLLGPSDDCVFWFLCTNLPQQLICQISTDLEWFVLEMLFSAEGEEGWGWCEHKFDCSEQMTLAFQAQTKNRKERDGKV